jgi:hypothetical protein
MMLAKSRKTNKNPFFIADILLFFHQTTIVENGLRVRSAALRTAFFQLAAGGRFQAAACGRLGRLAREGLFKYRLLIVEACLSPPDPRILIFETFPSPPGCESRSSRPGRCRLIVAVDNLPAKTDRQPRYLRRIQS